MTCSTPGPTEDKAAFYARMLADAEADLARAEADQVRLAREVMGLRELIHGLRLRERALCGVVAAGEDRT